MRNLASRRRKLLRRWLLISVVVGLLVAVFAWKGGTLANIVIVGFSMSVGIASFLLELIDVGARRRLRRTSRSHSPTCCQVAERRTRRRKTRRSGEADDSRHTIISPEAGD